MSSALQALDRKGIVHPPGFVVSNLHMEVVMGSQAYGVAQEGSDYDIYGFCVPPREVIFPHLAGVIPGFGDQGQRFDQYQQPHVKDGEKEYDFTIYNIVKYFKLCAECNPNMIDSLFVPDDCVKHLTMLGQHVRENRRLFLSKMAWARFKGYAYAQLHKLDNKKPVGKRLELVEKYSYDTKYAAHLFRLLNEVLQIMTTGDINLRENNDEIKAIRRGEVTEQYVRENFTSRIGHLERVYENCTLPARPDENRLKSILLECLEMHYGNLSECVVLAEPHTVAFNKIAAIIDETRNRGFATQIPSVSFPE